MRAAAALVLVLVAAGCHDWASLSADPSHPEAPTPDGGDARDGGVLPDTASPADLPTADLSTIAGTGGSDLSMISDLSSPVDLTTYQMDLGPADFSLAPTDLAKSDLSLADLAPLDLSTPHGWSVQTVISTRLWGVGGSSATDLYAVGQGTGGMTPPRLLHSTGNDVWTVQNTGLGTSSGRLLGIWAASATDVFVVGGDGALNEIFLRSAGNGTWTNSFISADTWLTAVWGSGPNDVYAVGFDNVNPFGMGSESNHSTDGTTFSQQPLPGTPVSGVWGSGPGDIYVVGNGGFIAHSNGNGTWTRQVSGTSNDLSSVWGTGANDLYAVGAGGTVLHSTGNGAWSAQNSGVTGTLYGIGGRAGELYLAGDAGVLYSVGNGSWVPSLPSTTPYDAVWMTPAGDLYAVGTDAIAHHR